MSVERQADGHEMVFVGGLHRSGTSLVARWLAGHPAISGFAGTGVPEDEGQHLQSVYPGFGGWGRFGFDPRSHMTEASPLVSEKSRERLLAQWGRHWDLDKPVLLEKSPPNLTKARFLQALFPRSSFVMVLRHPVAVAGATQRWSRPIVPGAGAPGAGRLRNGVDRLARPLARWLRPHRLVEHWVVCHETLLGDVAHVRRLALVRYEDLVRAPDVELARLCRFLGVEEHGAPLPVRDGLNEAYLRQWRGRGVNPVKRAYSEAIAARYEQRANRLGYSFRDLEPRLPSELECAARGAESAGR